MGFPLYMNQVSQIDTLSQVKILVNNLKMTSDLLKVKLGGFGESGANIAEATERIKTQKINVYKGQFDIDF